MLIQNVVIEAISDKIKKVQHKCKQQHHSFNLHKDGEIRKAIKKGKELADVVLDDLVKGVLHAQMLLVHLTDGCWKAM